MNPNNQLAQRSQGLKFGTGDNFGIQIAKDNIRSGENKFSNKRTEDLLISDKEHSEGELIEEDIQNSNEQATPLINAQTKQANGKAKALF
jgi:hypothetical protein